MVSPDFKATISEKNLLRARIMLKDSFVVDPTFNQLDEMLSYARTNLPNLFVPFDGEILENDTTKWNEAVMNEELVQLVTNFSETRVSHLKKVVAKVLESEATKIKRKRSEQTPQKRYSVQSPKTPVGRGTSLPTKEFARCDALRTLKSEANKIHKVVTEVESQGDWKPTNVEEMEHAARAILKATQHYRNNR